MTSPVGEWKFASILQLFIPRLYTQIIVLPRTVHNGLNTVDASPLQLIVRIHLVSGHQGNERENNEVGKLLESVLWPMCNV